MTDMSPDSWTQPEIVRAIQRIEKTQTETLAELRAQRAEYLHRDVYQADQKSLEAYKQQVAVDLVNVEAEQARVRQDLRAEVDAIRGGMWRFAGLTVAAAGVVVTVINALGLGAA